MAPAPPVGLPLLHAENALLAVLFAAVDRAGLSERPTYLSRGEHLWEAGSALTHVYFPARGVVSLGYGAENGDAAHLAFVGREGMVGVEGFLGAQKAAHLARVLVPGAAFRLPLGALRARAAQAAAAQATLLGYALALMLEISRTSVCNLRHSVEQRLCRALLQSADRLGGEALPLTQDEVAALVGARRQSVSEAAQRLRELGLLASGRGSIALRDRAGLEARACECYAVQKREVLSALPVVRPERRLFAGRSAQRDAR